MGTIEKYRFATTGYKMLLHEIFPCVAAKAILGQTTEAWFYSTLNAAVNDVNAGTIGTNEDATEASAVACVFYEDSKPVVGLLKDTTEATRIQPSADMTINLGGHTLSANNAVCINVLGGNLKIDGRIPGSRICMDRAKNAICVQAPSSSAAKSILITGGSYSAVATEGSSIAINNNTIGTSIVMLNCSVTTIITDTGMATGVVNVGNGNISRCTVLSYSNYYSDGQGYSVNSKAIENTGKLTLEDCYAMGTHSGLQNGGTLYVNGGTFESYGHGGIYFAGNDTTAYVRNATLKDSLTMPEGWEGTSQHNGAGFYLGGSSNNKVYMDNCDIYGSADSQIFVIKASDSALYVSNSTINNLKGGDTKIRIDGNNMMYLGIGNNFTAEDTNNPDAVIVTNEVYVQEVA